MYLRLYLSLHCWTKVERSGLTFLGAAGQNNHRPPTIFAQLQTHSRSALFFLLLLLLLLLLLYSCCCCCCCYFCFILVVVVVAATSVVAVVVGRVLGHFRHARKDWHKLICRSIVHRGNDWRLSSIPYATVYNIPKCTQTGSKSICSAD